MRKQGKRIKQRAQLIPVVVAKAVVPHVETAELMALIRIRRGDAQESDFNIMLDARDFLMFAAADKGDEEALNMAQAAWVALANIKDRWQKHGKVRATGDEANMLDVFWEYQTDWWNRQAGTTYITALDALHKAREQQREQQAA